jgi:hypothetical protein
MRKLVRQAVIPLVVGAVVACGDPGPDPDRGYVKPPLETPGLVVRGEPVSEMSELGQTNRPRPRMPEDVVPREDVNQ